MKDRKHSTPYIVGAPVLPWDDVPEAPQVLGRSSINDLQLYGRASQVSCLSLEPSQRPTTFGFETATNFYERTALKHQGRSFFHSDEERLYAGLLEGNPEVSRYVPQPIELRVHGAYYKPDFYVDIHPFPLFVELKPSGIMDEDMVLAISAFMILKNRRFIVVSNEDVRARRTEAENWLFISSTLSMCRDWNVDYEERCVMEHLSKTRENRVVLGDFVHLEYRDQSFPYELAIFRLLSCGRIQAELRLHDISLDTWIWPTK